MADHTHDWRWRQDVPSPSSVPGEVENGAALIQAQHCDCGEWGRSEWCPDGRGDKHGATLSHRHTFTPYPAS